MKSLALTVLLMAAPLAHAATVAPVYQAGPDLEFSCAAINEARTLCAPRHAYYKRYMHLANWRFVGSASGSCVLGQSYGYSKQGVWVAGNCQARFQAPDLRYGDRYNPERARKAVIVNDRWAM